MPGMDESYKVRSVVVVGRDRLGNTITEEVAVEIAKEREPEEESSLDWAAALPPYRLGLSPLPTAAMVLPDAEPKADRILRAYANPHTCARCGERGNEYTWGAVYFESPDGLESRPLCPMCNEELGALIAKVKIDWLAAAKTH